MVEYAVNTSTFSFGLGVVVPIKRRLASLAQPNCASDNCGRSTRLPERCWILDIWIMAISIIL